MTGNQLCLAIGSAAVLAGCAATGPRNAQPTSDRSDQSDLSDGQSFYLPDARASQLLTVTRTGPSAVSILVQTHRSAVKETGPPETIARFGEVYSFSPTFIAVHRDEPTQIRFWNLQPDDLHAFMLVGPRLNVLMNASLPPLQETSFIFTFHREGLFRFYCSKHQPSMAGQILVLPPQPP